MQDLQDLVVHRLRELGDKGKPMTPRAAAGRANNKVSAETIRLIAIGRHSGNLGDETVDALSLALDVPRSQILAALNRTQVAELGPWNPPSVANRMTRRQRKAVEQLITAMVEPETASPAGSGKTAAGLAGAQPDRHLRAVARKRPPTSRPHDE